MAAVIEKNSFHRRARALIDSTVSEQHLNVRSLIVSVFGDSVSAHGGIIWLGSLIRLVKPLSINQRQVRTSVFRLTEKDILRSRQIGRRSYYSFTDKGLRQFNHAAARIYRYENASWDGEWRLVFTNMNNMGSKRLDAFKKELSWLGFSRLSNGIYGHPMVDIDEVRQLVKEMRLEDSIVLMEASNRNDDPLRSSGNLVRHAFKFDAIDVEYRQYIDLFEGFLKTEQGPRPGDEELCFLVRTLLIHLYRRILLHEPELPRELVPADSLRHRAREMTSRIYHSIGDPAERHFMLVGESEHGALPPSDEEYFTRFQDSVSVIE